jgi:hypothetical protein
MKRAEKAITAASGAMVTSERLHNIMPPSFQEVAA